MCFDRSSLFSNLDSQYGHENPISRNEFHTVITISFFIRFSMRSINYFLIAFFVIVTSQNLNSQSKAVFEGHNNYKEIAVCE